MVRALQKKIGKIDELQVLYPQHESHLIELGYPLIEEHLKKTSTAVTKHTLQFPDTNSLETSIKFLQTLSSLINGHEHAGNNVYLSLAGGRKNMSALMAVTCQFFECICGLYHILDKHEGNELKKNFYSIEELYDLELKDKHEEKLSPPIADLNLVEIPYARLSNGVALRKYFDGEQSSITVEVELDTFYSSIFQTEKTNRRSRTDLGDVYLSKKAYDFYLNGNKKTLKTCFETMRDPQKLKDHLHRWSKENRKKTDCYCFAMEGKDERLFYYPKESTRITVAAIAKHKDGTYEEILGGREPLWSSNHPGTIHSNALEGSIFISPLGKSPMVVTQTFQLLEGEGANIKKVIVVHPNNAEIENGVELLKKAFNRRNKDFESCSINNIEDIKSRENCETYLERLVSVINNTKNDNSDKRIYLSLSGGRKGMAALTLFAAQQANIDTVYHTLITDLELEKRIEKETNITELQDLGIGKLIQRLFLHAYCSSKFKLFRVPVIPISQSSLDGVKK